MSAMPGSPRRFRQICVVSDYQNDSELSGFGMESIVVCEWLLDFVRTPTSCFISPTRPTAHHLLLYTTIVFVTSIVHLVSAVQPFDHTYTSLTSYISRPKLVQWPSLVPVVSHPRCPLEHLEQAASIFSNGSDLLQVRKLHHCPHAGARQNAGYHCGTHSNLCFPTPLQQTFSL